MMMKSTYDKISFKRLANYRKWKKERKCFALL